ncbi:MAG: transglutaminase domain-containing protein [Janthinobacterium lividum]
MNAKCLDRQANISPAEFHCQNPFGKQLLRTLSFLCLAIAPLASAYGSDMFMKPTKEELEMTSLPGFPGVAAVVLFREELTKDDMHSVLHYDRIKVLTEDGKKYANVELGFVSTNASGAYIGDDKMVESIVGRTIHSDGTVIPFTGKPYLKTMVKAEGMKYQAKVFTLPDVEVGSIIEYRYATRYSDYAYEAPDWYIQGDLFLKAAHFSWYPTTRDLQDERGEINTISWFPILPVGAKIQHQELPATTSNDRHQQIYDLVVKDIPPQPKEEYMPPIASYSYRVLFNFSSYRTPDEFWKGEGKNWSKRADSFANPNSALTKATQTITEGANTPEEKLQKIYAAVMGLENTDYTREHDAREDKANGLGKMNNAIEVLEHKRGNSTQITELFAGMARAAGMSADLMLVPDRSKHMFVQNWLTLHQFDDVIAIVNVSGKDEYLDPGSRYCAYKHLAWEHTFVKGIREKDGATVFNETPGDTYLDNKTSRVANLSMDKEGQIAGKLNFTYTGATALRWRQDALRGDEESTKHDLKTSIENMLPKTLEVKVLEVKNLDSYEKPLDVTYEVKGTIGSPTGKRLVIPADLFLSDSSATFPHDKRELAVYFEYPRLVQDALRINFREGFAVEAVPTTAKFDLPKEGTYTMAVTSTPTSFTTRRTFAFNQIFVLQPEYSQLRSFYSQFESNDQQSVVLRAAPATTAATGSEPLAK